MGGRYKASLIDSACYLLTCYRYIELNPVRAGMVGHPSEYPWSSYYFNALGRDDYLTVPHAEYLSLGKIESNRQLVYRGLFNDHLNEKTLDEIRSATNKAWVLGSDYFKEQIAVESDPEFFTSFFECLVARFHRWQSIRN